MVKIEDLLEGFICYGRGPVQDFVARSRNVEDTVHYLQMERSLEMTRLIPFVTRDLRSFERKKSSLSLHCRPIPAAAIKNPLRAPRLINESHKREKTCVKRSSKHTTV